MLYSYVLYSVTKKENFLKISFLHSQRQSTVSLSIFAHLGYFFSAKCTWESPLPAAISHLSFSSSFECRKKIQQLQDCENSFGKTGNLLYFCGTAILLNIWISLHSQIRPSWFQNLTKPISHQMFRCLKGGHPGGAFSKYQLPRATHCSQNSCSCNWMSSIFHNSVTFTHSSTQHSIVPRYNSQS